MTSIANKNVHSVSASLKSADMSVIKMNESDLQAEMIEVVPELPFNDSEDDFSEYSDENGATIQHNHFDDDDDEPFDEYGKCPILLRPSLIVNLCGFFSYQLIK